MQRTLRLELNLDVHQDVSRAKVPRQQLSDLFDLGVLLYNLPDLHNLPLVCTPADQ